MPPIAALNSLELADIAFTVEAVASLKPVRTWATAPWAMLRLCTTAGVASRCDVANRSAKPWSPKPSVLKLLPLGRVASMVTRAESPTVKVARNRPSRVLCPAKDSWSTRLSSRFVSSPKAWVSSARRVRVRD